MISLSTVLTTVGLLSLLHSAYSAAQHRSYLRLTQHEFEALPVDIVLQTILSLIVAVCGILGSNGEFKEIRATAEFASKTWDTVGNRPSFYTFKDGPKSKSSISKSSKSLLEATTS